MKSPLRSRRDFFSGGFQSLLKSVADAADLKEPLAFLGLDRTYVRMKRQAMATDFEVLYGSYENAKARETGMKVLDEIDRIESMMSIWKETSELSQVNRRAAQEPVRVSGEIFALARLGKQIYEETGGAFDLTSTPLSRCWGFFSRHGRIPEPEKINEALACVGMQHVTLDEEEQTIFFEQEGIELTPASIGKGIALDCAIAIAKEHGLNNVLINGGCSSVISAGAPAWKDAWQFHVRNPFDENHPLGMVNLKNRGFSSSGSKEQHFIHEGKMYGHILDPRTGWPADEAVSVNVIAPTAARAEALSTAFYVMGVEKTMKYCENYKDIGVLILCKPDENGKSEIVTTNLTQENLEVLTASC
ncbi:MAG: FAD:protein FMN transferase [Candidatus Omnitrophota bacterium]|nr:MAG: FAD:protein FMN transferase [Candidatus Omnitrophota bacterium]